MRPCVGRSLPAGRLPPLSRPPGPWAGTPEWCRIWKLTAPQEKVVEEEVEEEEEGDALDDVFHDILECIDVVGSEECRAGADTEADNEADCEAGDCKAGRDTLARLCTEGAGLAPGTSP